MHSQDRPENKSNIQKHTMDEENIQTLTILKQIRTNKGRKPVCVIESPYSGDIKLHIRYAQRAMAYVQRTLDCIPIVPHLMWTQHEEAKDHFVCDYTKDYTPVIGRSEALKNICVLRDIADCVIFFTDYGMSNGMKDALKHENHINLYMKLGNKEVDERNKNGGI